MPESNLNEVNKARKLLDEGKPEEALDYVNKLLGRLSKNFLKQVKSLNYKIFLLLKIFLSRYSKLRINRIKLKWII